MHSDTPSHFHLTGSALPGLQAIRGGENLNSSNYSKYLILIFMQVQIASQTTMSADVLRRQQSSIELDLTSSLMDDLQLRHRAKALARSKSLPVQVLQTKRRASIDRLNRDFRLSLQIQLTATLMSSQSEDEPKIEKRSSSIKFDPAIDMQVAVTNGDEDEMKQLILEHGIDIIDRKEPTGLPPVMRAIFEGELSSLQLLIDSGANLMAHDQENWNVLHVAAAMDDFESTEVIIASLPHRNLLLLLEEENVGGQKPVDLAEDEDMIKFLEETLVAN